MALLTVPGHPDERVVACDRCKKPLYRVRAGSTRPLLLEDDRHERPSCVTVVLEVGRERQFVFCGRACAADHIAALPEEEIRGGYPLWW